MNSIHKIMILAATFASSSALAQYAGGLGKRVAGDRRTLCGGRAAAAIVSAFLYGCHPADAQVANWSGSWTASPQTPRGIMPTSFSNRTIRQIVHLSVGGPKVRLRLSNEFGQRPVLIGAASIALAVEGAGIAAESLRGVTFGGAKSIIIPPGAPVLSDPVELAVAPLSDLAVSLYLPAATDLATVHATGLQTAYVSASGDYTASAEFPVADRFANRYFLTAVMVEPATRVRAIVAFGDSITDGTASTVNANRRWPDVLARRLKDAGIVLAVLNQGIAGNRVLSDGAGVSALARFERDVLSLPAVSHVIVFVGINDIGFPGTAIEPNGIVRTADEIIAGYKQLIERAHLRGLKVVGSPLTPFENALANGPNVGYFSPDKEAKRQAVNNWIRTSGAFDAIIDFDAVIADPAHPAAIASAFDSGDHLHPNDAGYKAMAEAIDLKLFQWMPTISYLKGEKPATLPVQQAARIELVVNLKVAKLVGITSRWRSSAAAAGNIETWEKEYFDRFDADKTIKLTSVVKEFQWSNPHAQILLTVRDEQREVIEMASVGALGRRPKTLTPGMPITVTIHPLRDGSNAGHLLTVRLPDGTQMDGGRDRPGVLQELRKEAVAAEALMAELVKNR